jgi:hypothetical protein
LLLKHVPGFRWHCGGVQLLRGSFCSSQKQRDIVPNTVEEDCIAVTTVLEVLYASATHRHAPIMAGASQKR